jgi:hypothetical protein
LQYWFWGQDLNAINGLSNDLGLALTEIEKKD